MRESYYETTIYAVCEDGNTYEFAKFAEGSEGDCYYNHSRVGDVEGYAYNDYYEEENTGPLFEEIFEEELQKYLNGEQTEKMQKISDIIKLPSQIKEFIRICKSDYSDGTNIRQQFVSANEIADKENYFMGGFNLDFRKE